MIKFSVFSDQNAAKVYIKCKTHNKKSNFFHITPNFIIKNKGNGRWAVNNGEFTIHNSQFTMSFTTTR